MVRREVDILSDRAIEALRSDHDMLARRVRELEQRLRALAALGMDNASLEPGITDGSGISAMSGTTPGSGTVTLYRMPAGGTDIATTTAEEICYNIAGAVGSNTYVLMARDRFGRLWVVVERC